MDEGKAPMALPGALLQFSPWQSAVDVGFWEKLASSKLDHYRLSEAAQPVVGFYMPNSYAQISSHLNLTADSLGHAVSGPTSLQERKRCQAPGTLHNTNTLEGFRQLDRKALLQEAAAKVWEAIQSGEAEKQPWLLNRFLVVSHADLKRWLFHYWLAFPALPLPQPALASPPKTALDVFGPDQAAALAEACTAWKSCSGGSIQSSPQEELSEAGKAVIDSLPEARGDRHASTPSPAAAPYFLLHVLPAGAVSVHPLSEWQHLSCQGGRTVVAFYDPCHLPTHPGWPLRNLLALAVARWHVQHLSVLCYRERRGRPDMGQSLVFDVQLPHLPEWQQACSPCPQAVGWEKNVAGKLGPRLVDLGPTLDPARLAANSVDLNLKLMRWRVLPSLEVGLLQSAKCLLLGAGTLGCAVARNLLAWGVRHIVLVDSGKVSYSNPVRQSLFTHEDCLGGGKPKAAAAAEQLRRIFPEVHSEGIQMSIPMPGHHVGEKEAQAVLKDCSRLKELIEEADCVFLLTDTRESRWLPTLLCAAANKMCINAALGFDTFLVMRHGAGPLIHDPSSQTGHASRLSAESVTAGLASAHISEDPAGTEAGPCSDKASVVEGEKSEGRSEVSSRTEVSRLGCYFCNDVVAPLDSTANRTLDQQCTVTRPGLAPMAAALAVELFVSLLHHPLRHNAPADAADSTPAGASAADRPLGLLPHQVRGFLAHFSQISVVGSAFQRCTACSACVVNEVRCRGGEFLLQAFNEPTFLEDLTGLTEMLEATEDVTLDWDDDDDTSCNDDF